MAAEGKTREFEEARELLLGWLKYATETPRRRWSDEAPTMKTYAYVRREAALALRWIGDQEAADGVDVSIYGTKPLEQAFERCFELRTRDLRHGLRDPAWPNEELTQLVKDVSSFERYRIFRLLDASHLMSPSVRPDGIAQYHRGGDPANDWVPRTSLASAPSLESIEAMLATLSPSHWWMHTHEITSFARSGLNAVRSLIAIVEKYWPGVTDSLNTNEYYCHAVVFVFSTVAFTIAQSVNPIPLLDSPPAAMP